MQLSPLGEVFARMNVVLKERRKRDRQHFEQCRVLPMNDAEERWLAKYPNDVSLQEVVDGYKAERNY